MSRRRHSSVVAETLLRIYDAHGTVTPELVVDEATPPVSPIHGYFEWNDAVAADQYRLQQAGDLIRSCRVRVTTANGDEHEIRQFISVRSASAPSNYVPTSTVTDPIVQRLILDQMQRDIGNLVTRYGHLEEFLKAIAELLPPSTE